jgi:hypothetical protein
MVGSHRVFRFFLALGFLHFDGESTLRPTTTNARR